MAVSSSIHSTPSVQFSSVQSLSHVQLFGTPWTAARQASLSITNSWSLPKLMSIESGMPPSHLILCCPLLLLPSILPSIRVFSNESALRIRWPKYWSFSFSITPSNEHPGLISFRMDWLDLLAAQGTLKSPLQHHSSKAFILRHSAFFTVQLSHSCMTTGKTIALTRWTFVGKVMSLFFNTLSRLVITFLPRSKHVLISCLQSPSAVILDTTKQLTVSTFGWVVVESSDLKKVHLIQCLLVIKYQKSQKPNICTLFAVSTSWYCWILHATENPSEPSGFPAIWARNVLWGCYCRVSLFIPQTSMVEHYHYSIIIP